MTNQIADTQDTEAALKDWLRHRIAGYVGRTPEDIRTDVSLSNYGLDSVYALTLVGDIEDHLGLTLEATLMWDHSTIDALGKTLAGSLPGDGCH